MQLFSTQRLRPPLRAILPSIFLILNTTQAADFAGGTGEPNDPYQIATAEQLISIGDDPNLLDKHYILINDIDLDPNLPGGQVFDRAVIAPDVNDTSRHFQGTPFNGSLDGQGYTINNLNIDSESEYAGLFGLIGEVGVVRNVRLAGGSVRGAAVYVPPVSGGRCGTGSLAGENRGLIQNCHTDVNITGLDLVGGLVGENRGKISDSSSEGSVYGEGIMVGGLVGYNYYEAIILNCYSTGSVSGTNRVGGLVGYNVYYSTVSDSYSRGSVNGTNYVGGLIGSNSRDAIILNCYSTGLINGVDRIGGLVGENEGIVSDSFWDKETSGMLESEGGTGLTSEEMKMASSFIAWGACGSHEVWTIDDGYDYPRLFWENKPGESIGESKLSDLLMGTGMENDPYQIYTAKELDLIGQFPCEWDKCYKLMADIDLADYSGDRFHNIGIDQGDPFTGIFDGNGHTIANLSLAAYYLDNLGLFGYVDFPDAAIANLGLIDPNIEAGYDSYAGCLVGYLNRGSVTNCYVKNGTASNFQFHVGGLGGLIGFNNGNLFNCHFIGSINGGSDVGGLVGQNSGTVAICYSMGSVSGRAGGDRVGGLVGYNNGGTIHTGYSVSSVSGWAGVGGLVGRNSKGSISASYSMGSVTGEDYSVGGLVGSNLGTVTNSYREGSVHGDDFVGGLVGYNFGSISTSYSTGSVISEGTVNIHGQYLNRFGGLVGVNVAIDSVFASYWDTETSGVFKSEGGVGLTTTEMQDINTYLDAGWDFLGERNNGTHEMWLMPPEGQYPVLSIFNGYEPPFLKGAGTIEDPYIVATPEDLGTVWYRPEACYRLAADIDLSGMIWSTAVAPGFSGKFEGQGHKLQNLSIYGGGYLGFFGLLTHGAKVSDLGLENVDIVGSGMNVGGLVGSIYYGTISNCFSMGSGIGTSNVGGLIGSCDNGIISNSFSTGSVNGAVYDAGGLIGGSYRSTITKSYSTVSVSGENSVGGLVGNNSQTLVLNSYSSGQISGTDQVGGLVGSIRSSTIQNSYSSGQVIGTNRVGGMVGYQRSLSFSNSSNIFLHSFWDIEASGISESDGGIGLTTIEMQDINTYLDSDWDFDDIWMICEGKDYPHLQREGILCE